MGEIDNVFQRLSMINDIKDLSIEDIKKLHKFKLMESVFDEKEKNRKLTLPQIAGKLGTSVSSISRTRKDLGLNSLFKYDVPLKNSKKKESNVSKENDVSSVKIKKPRGRKSKNNVSNIISAGNLYNKEIDLGMNVNAALSLNNESLDEIADKIFGNSNESKE